MKVAVILSTYDQPQHLRRVLAGYLRQQRPPDELVIADDGSGPETAAVVDEFAALAPYPISHYTHEHLGWRKNIIVNRAIAATNADYIIVSDGDCVPRADFVAMHIRNARPRRFLSGGDTRLSPEATASIEVSEILDGSLFTPARLRGLGLSFRKVVGKLCLSPRVGWIADLLNVSFARWGGSNASTWREALLAVNGLDERFRSPGKDDVELGERLRNYGFAGRHIRHQAICLHLHHPKGYWLPDEIARNLAHLATTRRTRRVRAPQGIAEAATPFSMRRVIPAR